MTTFQLKMRSLNKGIALQKITRLADTALFISYHIIYIRLTKG